MRLLRAPYLATALMALASNVPALAGPHLHFEFHRHGVWLDPERHLP